MSEAEKSTKETDKKAKAVVKQAANGSKKAEKAPVAQNPKAWTKGWKLALWGLLMAVWVFAVLIAVQFVLAFLIRLVIHFGWMGESLVEKPVFVMGYQAVVYALSLAVSILLPRKVLKYKNSRNELGLYGLPTWIDLLLGPVGLFVAMIGAGILLFVAQKLLPGVNWEEEQNVGFNMLFGVRDYLVAFFALVVAAPFCEEVLFRGWLYGKLRGRMSALPAILITSIAFGVAHMQWNVGVTVFVMSIVMCLLRELTGTIYAGLVVHILKNALAFYMLYVANPFPTY